MIPLIMIEKTADGNWRGMGLQHFMVMPRVGEHIEVGDSKGTAQIYEVVAVIHPLQPTPNGGDIIVRYVAEGTEFRTGL